MPGLLLPMPLLREPTCLAETGLSAGLIYDLALKIIYFSGEVSGQTIADQLRLPYLGVVDRALGFLIKEGLIALTGAADLGECGYNYVITQKGSVQAQEVLAHSQYVGPAPVALDAYIQVTRAQTIDQICVTQAQVREAFAHLSISATMRRRIGAAVNAARSLLLYGPSGNGKTSIAQAIATLFQGSVYIPYAVEIDGQIIRVFDASSHIPIEQPAADKPTGVDARWLLCRRPFIATDAGLTLDALNLICDPISKVYDAPPQMKANGGVFLLDDFGRQRVCSRDLLNRWIVPLEKRVDYLTLQNGKPIEIPFDALIVFATNLNLTDLVDDAFLRRIRHKIHVTNPTWDEFREIFRRSALNRNIPFDEARFNYLVQEHYIKAKREPRSVHPRDLLDQVIDLAKYLEVEPRLSKELIDAAVEAYFVQM